MRIFVWRAVTVLTLLAAVALAAPSLNAAHRKTDYLDKPIKEWREGPVRYILTRWEDNEFKDLKTEEERARFIESFWRRRDETPETPSNEFRAQFWKRVRDANHLYDDEVPRDGWRTDMGKIHILRGPPDDMTRDTVAGGHRGTIIWTYNQSKVPGVAPNVVIAFARDTSGEFRLSTEPTKDSDPKAGSPLRYQPPMGTARDAQLQVLLSQEASARYFNLSDPLIRQAGGPTSSTPLSIYSELAKLQSPPKEWELRETVSTQEFFGTVPMRARADFFRTTGDATLVVITAAVRSTVVHYRQVDGRDIPDVVFYGRITDLTGNDLVVSLERDGDFSPAPENLEAGLDEDLLFQGQAVVPPGSYKALLTVLDRGGGRAGSHTINLHVPDLSGAELGLSSLMLARRIEQDSAATTAATGSPFSFGTLRVLPRLGQTYKTGDELAFYYQVYAAAKDSTSGLPRLDVEYSFHTVAAEKTHDLGRVTFAGQQNAAHGYALSLKDWPAGPYLLRVTVTDQISGTLASREAVFEIR